ncbi:hypothetical protein TgHK011_001834 [Trichoderma gracile]|nr:hypothetical protein TgHK011_001834 [Trichoderma gracile]
MLSRRCADGTSAATSFIQLAKRRYSAAPLHAQQTPLEFLIPRRASQASRLQTPFLPMGLNSPSRPFTASTARLATICVRNPVKDEEGKEMKLEITPRAAQRLSEIMAKDKNPNLALRIRVESGGCHGFHIFQYVPDETESTSPPPNSPKIILDEPSLELLTGSKVDFTQELIGSQFKIVDNPYASSSCGCGTSFDIKA